MSAKPISIEAYRKHIDSGKAHAQWVRIYVLLRFYFPPGYEQIRRTRSELSDYTGIRLSSVCGRVNELIQAGLLTEYPRRNCQITNEPAHPVGVPEAFRLAG